MGVSLICIMPWIFSIGDSIIDLWFKILLHQGKMLFELKLKYVYQSLGYMVHSRFSVFFNEKGLYPSGTEIPSWVETSLLCTFMVT